MRDLKFACPHCEQHIKCEDACVGQTIACPACGRSVVVPNLPDEHHLMVSTGRVPVPAHAHGAPRADGAPAAAAAVPKPKYSQLAIASIALSMGSILLGPFGCIPGIIFGYLAKTELRQKPQLQGADLAKAGIWVGYSFLVIFTIVGGALTVWFFRTH